MADERDNSNFQELPGSNSLSQKMSEISKMYTPASTASCEFRLGSFTFDVPHLTLTDAKGEKRKLTSKEMELLYMLCEHTGETLERGLVLRTIWEEENRTNARSMDVYITKLRKYFKDDPDVDILNVHGVGFKLVVK